jgi:hypothetical protein
MSVSKYGYCYGRRPAVHPVGYRPLSAFETTAPAEAPPTFDPLKGASPFHMLGNGPDPTLTVNNGNPAGCCGFVMTVNANVVTAAATGEPFTQPTSNVCVTDYIRYDHGQDVGVSNAELLPYWRKFGLWGNKIAGYGSVNFRDFDEAMAYAYAYNGICTGIAVSEAMEEATQAARPWDFTGSAADDNILGGHDVFVFGRESTDLGVLATWGQRQKFTVAWWKHFVEECDAVVTAEQVKRGGDALGVDVQKLESYLDGIAS